MLARWVNENQRDWDVKLLAVAFAYRTSEHESIGFTPFFLQHGGEARIPADLVYGLPPTMIRLTTTTSPICRPLCATLFSSLEST